MRQLIRRIWYAIRQRQLEADLAKEIEFHRAMKQRELEQGGDSQLKGESCEHPVQNRMLTCNLPVKQTKETTLATLCGGVLPEPAESRSIAPKIWRSLTFALCRGLLFAALCWIERADGPGDANAFC
jgi:hypothetical protein